MDPLPVAERGAAADSLLASATCKFNVRQFSAVISDFDSLLRREPGNVYLQFYDAVALLQTGEIARSRDRLMSLNDRNSLFRYDAAFYLALGYLKD